MTLREHLQTANLKLVYKIINKRDRACAIKKDRPSLQITTDAYSKVVSELLSKKSVKPYHMAIFIKEYQDPFDKKNYPHVCFYNHKYVASPKGAKPWGGKNPPKGHYNCNDNKYNETFAMGWTPWSKIIDTDVLVDETCIDYSDERVLAEILWELTFYGWTEKKVKTRVGEIDKKIETSLKEVKNGKYIELPPKKDGGFKIVIPDSVMKDLKKKL